MAPRRTSLQGSPTKQEQGVRMLRRSSVGVPGAVGPAGADLTRSNSSRLDRTLSTKVFVPVRLVRSNTSANHSTSRRRLMHTPPRKAHPSESRYSNQSWRERRQEAEVEDLSSLTTPLEIIANRSSLVGALAQSARSSSNKSVLALVQVASATVAAITTHSPASISENKDEGAPSAPSPVGQSQRHQPPPSLPSRWRQTIRSMLIVTDALCIAANSMRLWIRIAAPTTPGFQVVLPAKMITMSSAERVVGGALWEASFAVFQCVSMLRLMLGGSAVWRRSNRVVPLSTDATESTPIQRIRVSSQSSASVAVGLHDRANAISREATDRGTVSLPPPGWLRRMPSRLSLRVKLVAYSDDNNFELDTESWTSGSVVVLLTHWILQLCIAADLSAGLPASTPDFFTAAIVLNMWLLPMLNYSVRRFSTRRVRTELRQFFHLIWIASSLSVTIIGIAVVPLAVFHHQCRGSFSSSTHRFDSTKRLDPEWMGRASLAMDWLVTTSAGPAALRVSAGVCVIVTVESILAAILEDAARLQRISEQSQRQSNPSAQRETSLTSAIPDVGSVRVVASRSRWLTVCTAMKSDASSPLQSACALALTLGIIAIAGHSSTSSSSSLPEPCVLQLRPWFDPHPVCAMLALECWTDAATSLNDLIPSSLPASATAQLKFLSIRDCKRLEVSSAITYMPALVSASLTNVTVASWTAPFAYTTHPNLRAVTLADATIDAPILSVETPPAMLSELLSCGADCSFPPVAGAQRNLMPLLRESNMTSCD